MNDLDLSPHPLVVGLATALTNAGNGIAGLRAAQQAATAAHAAARHAEREAIAAADGVADEFAKALAAAAETAEKARTARGEGANAKKEAAAAEVAAKDATDATQSRLDVAGELAADPNLPELAAFSGYLGGTVKAPPGVALWQVLYLDAKLVTWLLVQRDEILFHQRIADDLAAFRERDVIWVRSDAPLGGSSGSPSVWLTGDFTRAGDFAVSSSGGATSTATGIFCDATTPNCCPPRTRTPACR